MDTLEFWHEHIGQHLSAAPQDKGNLKVGVPTRLKRGIDNNPLGAGINVFYIACEGASYLIGKIELPNMKGLTFIPSEDTSGERFIAHWLAHEAPTDKPWMVGVIGNANPSDTIAVSQPPSLCVYCEANKNFEFNLNHFREDVALTQSIEWRPLAQAIHAYDDYTSLDLYRKEMGSRALTRLFQQTPDIKHVLRKLRAQPNNGEHNLLTLYNRAR